MEQARRGWDGAAPEGEGDASGKDHTVGNAERSAVCSAPDFSCSNQKRKDEGGSQEPFPQISGEKNVSLKIQTKNFIKKEAYL